VFQRTPSAIDVRGNRPTDPNWARSLKPGWQRERQENYNATVWEGLLPDEVDLVCDGWTEIAHGLREPFAALKRGDISPGEFKAAREVEDYRYQEKIRQRVDMIVKDRETAEKLKAYYRWNCKRPTFNDDYLPAFNRPNVTLVDVADTHGVERITENGIVAHGVEHAVDCIIFASGFEITTSIKRRLGIDSIEGRNGLSLYEHWDDGFKTFHGFTAHGFPNQFFTGYTQGGVSASLTLMLMNQTHHIAYMIAETLKRGFTTIEPTAAAVEYWQQEMRAKKLNNDRFLQECTPGYYNNEGGPVKRSHIGEVYGPGVNAFNALLESWRREGGMVGMDLGGANDPPRPADATAPIEARRGSLT
jgi:cyclohexanone monooxygenase